MMTVLMILISKFIINYLSYQDCLEYRFGIFFKLILNILCLLFISFQKMIKSNSRGSFKLQMDFS